MMGYDVVSFDWMVLMYKTDLVKLPWAGCNNSKIYYVIILDINTVR